MVTTYHSGPKSAVLFDSNATVLLANANYTSAAFTIAGFDQIRLSVFADQVGATDGIEIQQSPDGTNYDKKSLFTYDTASDVEQGFFADVMGVTGKIKFTNGATNQGTFRIYTFGVP